MKQLERFHLIRAACWPPILALILLAGWQNSVFVVIALSVYANLAGDVSAWQAARAERRGATDG